MERKPILIWGVFLALVCLFLLLSFPDSSEAGHTWPDEPSQSPAIQDTLTVDNAIPFVESNITKVYDIIRGMFTPSRNVRMNDSTYVSTLKNQNNQWKIHKK
jgi:hypothetical protein